jgi:hypothetical protein
MAATAMDIRSLARYVAAAERRKQDPTPLDDEAEAFLENVRADERAAAVPGCSSPPRSMRPTTSQSPSVRL